VDSQERHPGFPSFWQAFGILALLLFLEISLASLVSDFGMTFSIGDPRGYVISVLATGIVLSFILAYKQLDHRRLFSPGNLSFESVVKPLVLPLLLVCGSIFVLSWEVSNLTAHLIPMSDWAREGLGKLLTGGLPSVITICVLAPVIEEMLFRGVFLRSFLNRHSPWTAILLSSLLFGFVHFDPGHIVVATLLGTALGWLYYATRSLWPSVIAHAFQNGGVMLYVHLVPESVNSSEPVPIPLLPIPVLLAAGVSLYYGARQITAASQRAR
jgi:membrane protease YdiL (CAAX protease family)